MRKNARLFRLTSTVALTALLWNTLLPLTAVAVAQPAPPPLPAPGEGRPDLNQADPPDRVGRIANISGTVSFHNLGDTQWSTATLNYPVSSGNAFWTEPSSVARLEISDSIIVMAAGTEFDVTALDASGLQGIAALGEIYLHARDLASNEAWSIQTPRGLVRLGGNGRYAVVVGTTDQPTLITTVEGVAQIDGPGFSLRVASNQTATITGTDSFQGSVGPALRDAFLTASLEAERPPPAPAVQVPPQVVAMAGGSDLVGTGTWSQAPDYGQVWYPPVSASWVPYREGHWAYVAPWGWTWVDDAPWGFAPFHYGRWIQFGGRWAWTPGEVAVAGPPVYAPALVTFLGIGAGIALGASLASGSIGWVPLGPREQYHPWYHASDKYIRQVNVSHVTNIANNVTINNYNNYANHGAATFVPTGAMTGSRPVQAAVRPVTAQEFAAVRPVSGQQPIRPTAATAGVTPVVARQLNLAPAAAAIHPAPGPAVRPVAAGVTGFAKPALAPADRIQAPGSVEQGRPAPIVPVVRPAGVPTPEAGVPAAVPPPAPHPGEPGAARPEVARPPPGVPTPQAGGPAAVLPPAPHPGEPSAARSEVARPLPGGPTPQAVGPAAVLPPAPHPGEPGAARLEAARPPAAPLPSPAQPVAVPQAAPRLVQPGAARPEVARPPGVPPPEPARPVAVPQAAPRPVQPSTIRPEFAPVAPHPAPEPAPRPAPLPRVVEPMAQPVARPAPAPVRPVPHPEPPRAAPPPARPAAPPHPVPQEHTKDQGAR